MRAVMLTDRIALLGSGALGFGHTDPFDCHVVVTHAHGDHAG